MDIDNIVDNILMKLLRPAMGYFISVEKFRNGN